MQKYKIYFRDFFFHKHCTCLTLSEIPSIKITFAFPLYLNLFKAGQLSPSHKHQSILTAKVFELKKINPMWSEQLQRAVLPSFLVFRSNLKMRWCCCYKLVVALNWLRMTYWRGLLLRPEFAFGYAHKESTITSSIFFFSSCSSLIWDV